MLSAKIKPYLAKGQATRGKRQAASQAKGKAGSQQKNLKRQEARQGQEAKPSRGKARANLLLLASLSFLLTSSQQAAKQQAAGQQASSQPAEAASQQQAARQRQRQASQQTSKPASAHTYVMCRVPGCSCCVRAFRILPNREPDVDGFA